LNKFRDEFDKNETDIMEKLKVYTLRDIKYLFSTDMSYFNKTAHPNLKDSRNLNDAINSQKQDTKLILERLWSNLKLN
jgi:hypothetical protein